MSDDSAALDFLARLERGEIQLPALGQTLGLEAGVFGPGAASFTLKSDPEIHGNVMGTLHGGVLATLADTAMGFAFATTLTTDESFATLEFKVSFLRPVWKAVLTASATVIHRGRTTGLVDCRITDERDRLIAHATSTCLVLSGAQAEGRRLGDKGAG
jgi:uncharacterized protein (TIGR00369 family)